MLTTDQLDALPACDPATLDAATLAELVRVYRLVLAATIVNGDTGAFRDVYDELGLDYGDGDVRLVVA